MKISGLTLPLKLLLLSFLFVMFAGKLMAGNDKLLKEQNKCQELNEYWLEEALHLTKVTAGFSAPVAARALMYFNLALYESSLLVLPANQSLSGQLSGFNRQTWPTENELLFASLVNNIVAYKVLSHLYRAMPLSEAEALDDKYNKQLKQLSKGVKKIALSNSLIFGEALAEELIEWSKLDGGDDGYKQNFPNSYVLPVCDSCWTRTFPGYKYALQPYWGQNTLMIQNNKALSEHIPFIGYSTDTSSLIYKDALRLYELYTKGGLTKEMKVIAEYWNDAPGYSGTPSGHFFTLALSLSRLKQLDLKTSTEMMACLGVAINDAVIETFRLKYHFNLLRPISYINRNIGKGFNTIIPTPPFPEFPSGHSCQSGAGSEVLISFLSNNFGFTDETNEDRVDINGTARSFENIRAMSEEISISRYYGGIHFLYTLDTSLAYGRKIGLNTVAMLKFEK